MKTRTRLAFTTSPMETEPVPDAAEGVFHPSWLMGLIVEMAQGYDEQKSFSWDSPGFGLFHCHNYQQRPLTFKSIS